MNCCAFFIAYLLPLTVLSQSTIIVCRTKDEITVGVDGNPLPPAMKSPRQTRNFPEDNKISKAGAYYYVIAGTATDKSKTAAEESCQEARTLAEVLTLYKEKRTKSLADEMYNCKLYYTEYYRNALLNKYVLSIAFFAIDNDTPKAAKIEFYVKDKINSGIRIESNTWLVPGKNKMATSVMVLGKKDALSGSDIMSVELNADPVREIERLLKKQIKTSSAAYGFPIQIIQVKKDGILNIPKISSCSLHNSLKVPHS